MADAGTATLAGPRGGDAVGAAYRAYRARNLDAAAAWCYRALAGDPRSAAALHLLAVLRHEQGEFDDAVAHARAALRFGADDPSTRGVLGVSLCALGRYGEAVAELREAVRLRPELAASHEHLGAALLGAGQRAEARAAFVEAARLDPNLARAYAQVGRLDLLDFRLDDARRFLARAVELDPGQAVYWELMAEAQAAAGQYGAAVRCWERVLALGPDTRAQPHVALGWALQEEGRPAEAEAHYLAAAALEPGSPDPLVHLGGLAEERGDFAAAESAFRAARELRPGWETPHYRLARLLRDRLPESDLAALCALRDRPDLPAGDRARLSFALGAVLDARGNYPGAADCYKEATAYCRTGPGPSGFRPEGHERFVDDLARVFSADHFARIAGAGLATRRPVFIVGLPRSGTTLLEQVLASHPAVHGAGELRLGRRMFEFLPVAVGPPPDPVECVARLDRESVRRLAGQYDARFHELTGGRGERAVDKMPENYLYLGLLLTLYPNATVLYCRRDLRDVALSCWTADFRHVFWAHDPNHIAAVFRAHLRLMDHWRATLPVPVHTVDYEAMVGDLEGTARRVLAATGLDWDPACLDFHRNRRTVRTASLAQVRRPVYGSSVGRWRHYAGLVPELFAPLPENPSGPGNPSDRS